MKALFWNNDCTTKKPCFNAAFIMQHVYDGKLFCSKPTGIAAIFYKCALPRGKNALRTRKCTREQLPKWLIVAGSQLRGEISTICEAKKKIQQKHHLWLQKELLKKVLCIQHREQQEIVDSAHNARVTEWFTRAIGHSHLELLYDCVLSGVFRLRNRLTQTPRTFLRSVPKN